MKVYDIFSEKRPKSLDLLKNRCSDFIYESDGRPLFKSFPSIYDDFQKVKVRKRKSRNTDFSETFNGAFDNELYSLRERAVFANGEKSFQKKSSHEEFYVFPIDGFKYLYSSEVQNSNQDYKTVFDAIYEEFGSERGNNIITELLKFSYTSSKLYEGIDQGAEIIIYNIPYYYAIRSSTINYNDLIQQIQDI